MYLVLKLPMRLISPQHLAQEHLKSGIDTTPRGTINTTTGVDNVLSWADNKFRVTTALTQGSNIALLNSVPGYGRFSAFMDLVGPDDEPADLFPPISSQTMTMTGDHRPLLPLLLQMKE